MDKELPVGAYIDRATVNGNGRGGSDLSAIALYNSGGDGSRALDRSAYAMSSSEHASSLLSELSQRRFLHHHPHHRRTPLMASFSSEEQSQAAQRGRQLIFQRLGGAPRPAPSTNGAPSTPSTVSTLSDWLLWIGGPRAPSSSDDSKPKAVPAWKLKNQQSKQQQQSTSSPKPDETATPSTGVEKDAFAEVDVDDSDMPGIEADVDAMARQRIYGKLGAEMHGVVDVVTIENVLSVEDPLAKRSSTAAHQFQVCVRISLCLFS